MTYCFYGIIEKPEIGLKIVCMSDFASKVMWYINEWIYKDHECIFTITNDEMLYKLHKIDKLQPIDLDNLPNKR